MGSYTYGPIHCLWRNSIFSFRIHSKDRMIKEVRVEYSVSELMHIFELSLKKDIHLYLLKTHFDSYHVFLASDFLEKMEATETFILDLSAFLFGPEHTHLGAIMILFIFVLFLTLY